MIGSPGTPLLNRVDDTAGRAPMVRPRPIDRDQGVVRVSSVRRDDVNVLVGMDDLKIFVSSSIRLWFFIEFRFERLGRNESLVSFLEQGRVLRD